MPPQSVRFFIASMVALGNGRGWGPEQGHGLQRRVSRCRRNAVFLLVLRGLGRDDRGKIGAARVVLLKRQLGGAPGGFGGLLEQGQALAGTDEGTHGVLGFLQCL